MKSAQVFAVRFLAKEAINANGIVITKEDTKCWLVDEPEGWVPATAQLVYDKRDGLPKDLKVFESPAEAEAFMQKWGGHPWYYVPKSWEVVPVMAHTKVVFSHYALTT